MTSTSTIDQTRKKAFLCTHSITPWISVGVVVALFAILLAVWFSFDHMLPAPDDASYTLDSFRYAELLKHPKFWKPDWWHSMLSVNQAYPPTVMLFNGVLRLVLGFGDWVNVLSVVIFGAILTATVFGTTWLLLKDKRAAVVAAIVVNLYPQNSLMSHGFALDAPLMAMVSLGLFSMLWWRTAPSWPRALACGVALGCACMTKQIAFTFLLVPGFYCLFESVKQDLSTRRFRLSAQVISMALVTACMGLPWLLTNLAFIKQWSQANQALLGSTSVWQVFPDRIVWYAKSLPSIMSPLLFGCFILSLLLIGRAGRGALLPAGLSGLCGVMIISTLTSAFPSLRYDAPAMIATAIYTGAGFSVLLGVKFVDIGAAAVLAVAFLQYIAFNFAPYPIANPDWVAKISEVLRVNLVERFGLTARDMRESQVRHSNPTIVQDWGHEWALKTIMQVDGKKSVFLNILPNCGLLNGNTFEFVGSRLGSSVHPTTSRHWTVLGDVVSFDPKEAMYYQWYILKTGYQGLLLKDEQSENSYRQLQRYITGSGNFRLIGTHKIADNSTMSLYRQK